MRVMDELITKQSAVEAMRELFRYAYCDNCQYGGSRSDNCDGCHRKYNNWRASDLLLTWTIRDLPSAEPTLRERALMLLLNWAVECDFGYDNFPEEYERYKDEIKDMSYFDGMIYIAEKEVERNG